MGYIRGTDEERALYVAIGAQIRKARLKRGLTQIVLGERSGNTQGWIAHLETGRIRPSLWNLATIADVLRIPIAVLFPEAYQGDTEIVALQRRVWQLETAIEKIKRECDV